ncbi:MAG: PAS domain S-box protein [Paludibacter sp.]
MIKFNIQSKIRIAFAIVFSIMLMVTIYLSMQMNTISEQTRLLYEHPYHVSNAIREIKTEIFLNQNLVRNIRLTENDQQLNSLRTEIDKNNKIILENFKIVSLKYLGKKATVDSTLASFTGWKNTCEKLYQLKKNKNTHSDSIESLIKNNIIVKFDNLVYFLTIISDFADNKAENTFKKVIKYEADSKFISSILLLVSCILVIYLMWFLTRSITSPIQSFLSEANILLNKETQTQVIADEQVFLLTLAELKSAYKDIELHSHEIETKNNELEEKVELRSAELIAANKELSIQYESSRYLASIVESTEDAIISKSLDGTIKSWNNAAEKMFGYTAEEAIGKNILMIFPPENTIDENIIVDKIVNDEIVQHYETVRMRKSGEIFPVSLTVSLLKDVEGKITGISKIIHDITIRKQFEDQLIESEKKYSSLFYQMQEGFALHEIICNSKNEPVDYRFLDINPTFEQMTGLKKSEIIGKTVLTVMPETEKFWIEKYGDVALTGNLMEFENYSEQLNRYYQIKAFSPAKNQFAVIFNDISKRKELEVAKQKWNNQFNKLSANTPGMIYQLTRRTDGSFCVPISSEGIRGIYGLSPEDVMDDFSPIVKVIHPDDIENLIVEIENSAKNLTDFSLEYRTQLPGESIKWLFAKSTPEKMEDGTINWYGFIADFTERKLAEEKLNNTLHSLELSNKDLEQFAYVANHDLQEPLRMISSYTQLLERKYKDKLDQDANEYIHYAVDGAIRMQKQLIDLLEYSKISKSEKPFEKVDTSSTLGRVISNLQLLITSNRALITIDDLPVVKAVESQMLSLFQNLIENAIKFQKKTELPKIHISCTKQNNMFQFSVADNGIGIEKQYHDRIFIVFQRLHSVKDYPGTGIGLSVCKRIVERHGGTIWFESTVNKGTIFYFTIPA